jgi:hypothetical protein
LFAQGLPPALGLVLRFNGSPNELFPAAVWGEQDDNAARFERIRPRAKQATGAVFRLAG